ncbi:MAG: bifunctional glutamate N-acetyltransferase/amino-acid acetyltransferase ArgJ, partial [Rhodospirillaceae bacterium]|nr:bifunctional glutamate N-acetyltransferase/amino-acid acetyltransferase ArgJ [Rhodospirillaceae bacterium]
KILSRGQARAIVVNSGNANAFTGLAGDTVVAETVKATAKLVGCPKDQVYVASTGVIGEPVPPDYIAGKLPGMVRGLKPGSWRAAAEAIMTTDTFPKAATRTAMIGNTEVTLAGFTKGSGMIAPDMATMLGFVFTDAKIPARVLQSILKSGADKSYNAITVDSDTSTSDTVLLFATGKGKRHPAVTSARDAHFRDFRRALDELLVDLATQVVRDGEGAQKLVTIDVSGAVSSASARKIGLTVANSPLVKTAIAGEDANWGRIVMAVGKTGEPADRDKLSISMGGVPITEWGVVREDYVEDPVAEHMKGRNVHIAIDIGLGRGKARVWTCDLTHGYITINADYRS